MLALRAGLLRGAGTALLRRPAGHTAAVRCMARATQEFGSTDGYFESEKLPNAEKGDLARREFSYFLLGCSRFLYASTVRVALIKFIASMSASADVLAMADAEFDVSAVPEGTTITVKWRGKPVFIRHRTTEEIEREAAVDLGSLRDPEADADRYQKPEWLVLVGICTHLGCVPLSDAGDFSGGWFCPCHGSAYDASGRIRRGPAPLNMEIPPYKFLSDTKILVG